MTRHARLCRRTLLVACSTLVLAACAAPTPSGTGGLVAQQSTLDLGRVPFDRQVEAVYLLTNNGDRPVALTAPPQVKTLEGC
jgi:hypothetical protein